MKKIFILAFGKFQLTHQICHIIAARGVAPTLTLCLLVSLTIVTDVVGQAQPIRIFWNQSPPYPYIIEDYQQYENTIVATIQNNGTTDKRIRVRVQVTGDNGISVASDDNEPLNNPFVVPAGFTIPMTGKDIWDIGITYNLQELIDKFTVTGINPQSVVNSKVIPEGNYEVCLTALDYDNPATVLSPPTCFSLNIQYAQRPIIINPGFSGFEYPVTTPPVVSLAWVLPGGPLPMGASIEFQVKIVDLAGLESMSLQEAINSTGSAAVYDEQVMGFSLLLTDIPFIEGHEYVMRVKAIDASAIPQVIFQFNGDSELTTFFFGTPASSSDGCGNLPGDFSVIESFPVQGDTLPFGYLPVIVKWEPYCANYSGFNSSLVIDDPQMASPALTASRDATWAKGDSPAELTEQVIKDFNKLAFPDFEVPEGQALEFFAQHTAIDAGTDEEFLIRGHSYSWSADFDMKHHRLQIPSQVVGADFAVGMPKPYGLSPAPGEQKPLTSTSVDFSWSPGQAPAMPYPPFWVIKADYNGGGADWVELTRLSPVQERFVVQVTRSSTKNFDDPGALVHFETGLIDYNRHNTDFQQNRTFEAVRSDFLSTVYGDRTFTWNYGTQIPPGSYHWRIGWQRNPIRVFDATDLPEFTDFYWTSDTMTFWIGDTDVPNPVTTTPPPPPSQPCEPCSFVVPANQTALASLSANTEVQVGKFKMKLTEVTMNGTQATGKGLILDAPYFKAGIKTIFSNVTFNTDKQLITGVVKAAVTPFGNLDASVENTVARISGWDQSQIENWDAFIHSGQRLVESFVPGQEVDLPIGLQYDYDTSSMTVALTQLEFHPDSAIAHAVAAVYLDYITSWLVIGVNELCINPSGISAGMYQFYVGADLTLGSPEADGIEYKLKGNPDPQTPRTTKMHLTCNRIDSLVLCSDLVFSRADLLPVDQNGDVLPSGHVIAQVDGIYRKNDGLLSRIHMQDFAFEGAPDWAFSVNEAWYDRATKSNPPVIQFPAEYPNDRKTNWKGFYLKSLTGKVPQNFKKVGEPGHRFTFGAFDCIKDGTGFWYSIKAVDVVPIEEGDMGGWACSLDTIAIVCKNTNWDKFEIKGKIATPVNDTATLPYVLLRGYTPHTTQGNTTYAVQYTGRVDVPDAGYKMQFANSSAAKAALFPDSFLEIMMGDSTAVNADLSGYYDLEWANAPGSSALGRIDSLKFQGMKLRSHGADKFDWGTWAFSSPQRTVKSFPVSISDIRGIERNSAGGILPEVGLQIEFQLVIGDTNTFVARSALNFWAGPRPGSTRQSYVYQGTSLDRVEIEGNVGPVSARGGLYFYERDDVYGDGFRGQLQAKFLNKVEVEAIAQFGRKDENRYWMVDGLAILGAVEVPIFPPAVVAKGFGGGVYKNMTRVEATALDLTQITNKDSTQIGIGLSKVKYIPAANSGGVNLKCVLGPQAKDTYRAVVEFRLAWAGGSVSEIGCAGKIRVMPKEPNDTIAPIIGTMDLSFDLVEDIFEGQFDVDINMAKGKIVGDGHAHIYYSSSTWFLKIGEPAHKNTIDFKFDTAQNASALTVQAYFMLGQNLPAFTDADLPATIRAHLPEPVNGTRAVEVSNGDGIALGFSVELPEKEFNFLFIYATAELGFGFDLSLMHYDNVACPGQNGFGADGWYAKGRMYGYIEGEFGVKVDLSFISGKYAIGRIGAGAIVEGGLPNPSYARGSIYVHYSVLGGAFEGSKNFKFFAGKICDPNAVNIFEIAAVEQMTPAHGSTNQDCGVFPQVIFNLKFKTELQNVLYNGSAPTIEVYRINFDQVEIKRNGTNQIIPMSTLYRENNFVLEYQPNDMLPGNREIKFSLRVWVEKKNGSTWQPLLVNGVRKDTTYISVFKTGAYPDHIAQNVVVDAWPRFRQRFFLKGECATGGIQLKQGMNLFPSSLSGSSWKYEAVFTKASGTGDTIKTPLQFYPNQSSPSRIEYQVPGALLNSTAYKMSIVGSPVVSMTAHMPMAVFLTSGGNARPALTTVMQLYQTAGDTTADRVYKRRQDAVVSRSVNKVLFNMHFKTSQYNTLQAKMNALASSTELSQAANGAVYVGYPTGFEGFDRYDLKADTMPGAYQGSPNPALQKLVTRIPIQFQEQWYFDFVFPKIQNYWQDMFDCCRQVSIRCIGPGCAKPFILTTVISPPQTLRNDSLLISPTSAKSYLSDLECGIFSGGGLAQSVAVPVGGIAINPGNTPSYSFTLHYGIPAQVKSNYQLLKTDLERYYQLACINSNTTTCNRVNSYLQPGYYKQLYSGQYMAEFQYTPTFSCGPDIDTGNYFNTTKGRIRFNKQ